jgi:hypothetical protein
MALPDDLDIGRDAFCGAGSQTLVMLNHSGDDAVNEAGAIIKAVAIEQESQSSPDVGRLVAPEGSSSFGWPQGYPLPGDEGEFALDRPGSGEVQSMIAASSPPLVTTL